MTLYLLLFRAALPPAALSRHRGGAIAFGVFVGVPAASMVRRFLAVTVS